MRTSRVSSSGASAVFGVLFIIIGVGLAAGAILMERQARRLREGAVHTTGTVVNVLPRGDGRKIGSTDVPVIRFATASGGHVDFSASPRGNPRRYTIGDAVPVYYHPDNPRFADVDDTASRWAGTLLFGGLSLVFLGAGVHFLRTSERA